MTSILACDHRAVVARSASSRNALVRASDDAAVATTLGNVTARDWPGLRANEGTGIGFAVDRHTNVALRAL